MNTHTQNQNTFDDKPLVMPPPFDPFEDAPTLHFSDRKPIALDDIKRALAIGCRPRAVIGWGEAS